MVNYKFERVVLAYWLFFWVSIFDNISDSFVEGKQTIPEKYRGLEHKGTIKTIVCPEDDEVIDCVDFYKQPAFDDPRIKSLEVEPGLFSDDPGMTDDELTNLGLYQNWRKYGKCPNGTIPIRRTLNRETYRKKGLPSKGSPEVLGHEYAIVEHDTYGDVYFGARGNLSVWNPIVESKEFSLTQIWVAHTLDAGEVIEAGWTVFPLKYKDLKTRFFIFWTSDSYHKTGCYDLDCPGFVQTDKDIALGSPLNGVSTYKNKGYYIRVAIYKAEKGGNWWLNLNGRKVGYWPNSLFVSLKDYALTVQWGGEIVNNKPWGYHTSTQMGSGHFPYEGIHRASYVANLAVRDTKLKWVDVKSSDLERRVTKSGCYNLTIQNPSKKFGAHFFYGGPGYSPTCRK